MIPVRKIASKPTSAKTKAKKNRRPASTDLGLPELRLPTDIDLLTTRLRILEGIMEDFLLMVSDHDAELEDLLREVFCSYGRRRDTRLKIKPRSGPIKR